MVSENWIKSASRDVKPARIDPSAPNPARVWDALQGGRDNFEADRLLARHLVAVAPSLAQVGAAVAAFRSRVLGYLAGEAGIRQFLDIGLGMRGTPTSDPDGVAHAVPPDCRFLYVINDPVVLSHARAALRSPTEGAISYIDADPRHIESVLRGAREILDLAEPVAVVITDTLNFMRNASGAIARIVATVSSGSYLAIVQSPPDEGQARAARRWNRVVDMPVYLRDAGEVGGWFAGCDLVEPGVVEIDRWRPGPDKPEYPAGMPFLGAVARKR
jgi:S-adenosyl methyltransferase